MKGQLAWIFTLGEPPAELMKLLWGWTVQGGMDWVLVPVPEQPGQEAFEHLPEEASSFFGVG